MPRHRLIAFVVVLVVASLAAPAIGQVGTDARVLDLAYSGDGTLDESDGELELWRSEGHQFTATVETERSFDGEVCLTVAAEDSDRTTTLACERATFPGNSTQEVAVGVESWPDNHTGVQHVRAELHTNETQVDASGTISLTVIEKDGDLDDDGLENEDELAAGSDLRSADTDGDGLDDGEEVNTYDTSPTNEDSDGDGLSDRAELETHQTDPTDADTDSDGIPDGDELSLGTDPTQADTDGDGLDDALEVNTYGTNATKADTDGDGLDDGIEIEEYETNPTAVDTDDDGLNDALEVNTYGTDPNTVDSDGDGLADGAEVDEYGTDPSAVDTDEDGLEDGREVNTYGTNPTNADTDGDGLEDGAEVNQYGTDPTEADTDGDGVGDRAEVDPQPWGHLPLPVILIGALATVMSVAGGVLYRSHPGLDLSLDRFRSTAETPSIEPPEGARAHETGDGDDEVPVEFLSNEERIHRLLEENGGRMRQAEIVDRTGWSKSKVSRVLSGMAEDDTVVKVDVGKGNVITLPEHVPQGAESPFDE